MTEANMLPANRVRYIHEILLSANLALLGITVIFAFAPNVMAPFLRIDASINRSFGIRQTDFVRGYFAIIISTALLALLIWGLLRLSSRTWLTNVILRSASGIAVLLAIPALWFWANQQHGWPYGWPYRGVPVELALVLLYLVWFLSGKRSIPGWYGLLLLVVHYAFWFWIYGSAYLATYIGPAGTILGFGSMVAWGIYVNETRRAGGWPGLNILTS